MLGLRDPARFREAYKHSMSLSALITSPGNFQEKAALAGGGSKFGWGKHVCGALSQAYWGQHHGACIYNSLVAKEGTRGEQGLQDCGVPLAA